MDKIMGQITGLIPFVLAVGEGKFKLNTNRIIEAVIIAVLAGAGSGYIASQKMAVEINHLHDQIKQVQVKIDCIDNRLWQHQTQTEGRDK